jgi:two-component system chemotaxis sensor kinase CheA
VAFFLLFDLGVLVLNFYTSFQIAQDAVGINLSGRQRMLSQRTAKAMLAVETARAKGVAAGPTWTSWRPPCGCSTRHSRASRTAPPCPAATASRCGCSRPRASAPPTSCQGAGLWTPYQQLLAPVLAGSASDAELQAAVDYARTNNLRCWA